MATSRNRCEFIGHLGDEPKTYTTGTGKTFCRFSMATSESWTDKHGEVKERTEWHDVVVFAPAVAEACAKYLKKGSRVAVVGSLHHGSYTDKDGIKRRIAEIQVKNLRHEVIFLDGAAAEELARLYAAGAVVLPQPEDSFYYADDVEG